MVQPVEELPKLRKTVVKKEEVKKEEVKKTKVKVAKAKKYEDLPEIPDYERPELEVYQESEFEPTKPGEKARKLSATPPQQGVESKAQVAEPAKNGLPKVSGHFCLTVVSLFFVTSSTIFVPLFQLTTFPENWRNKNVL